MGMKIVCIILPVGSMFSSQSTPSLEEHHLFWAPSSSLTPGTRKPRIRWWTWNIWAPRLREEFLAELPADNGRLHLPARAASLSGPHDFPFPGFSEPETLAILLLMSGFGSRKEEGQHHLLYPRDQNWTQFPGVGWGGAGVVENNRESSLAAVEPSSWWHCPLLGSFPLPACTA